MNILKQKLAIKSLNIQVILLIIIPVLYISTLYFVTSVSEITTRQYLENNLSETLELLSVSCYLISAVIVSKYKKQLNQKYLLLSYLIIFISNIINFNIIIVGFMGMYIKSFIKLKEIKSYFKELRKDTGKTSLTISITILSLSVLIAYIKFTINI